MHVFLLVIQAFQSFREKDAGHHMCSCMMFLSTNANVLVPASRLSQKTDQNSDLHSPRFELFGEREPSASLSARSQWFDEEMLTFVLLREASAS